MKCSGCKKEKNLINAHVIPEAFFVGLREKNQLPKLVTDTKGVYPKRCPIGVYDKNILCKDCEERFQQVDNYGVDLLLKKEHKQEKLMYKERIAGYKITSFDYSLLKLFFISILWRASISKHTFYSKVDLGPFEDIAKNLIWNNDPGEIEIFPCVLAKFTDNKVGRIMFDPHREKFYGINQYRFYLFGYVLYIKVDQQKKSEFYEYFGISKRKDLIIIGRNFNNSKEFPVLKKIIENAGN